MSERGEVLRRVVASRRLRRVALAFLGFGCAEFGVWVAMLVYAYAHGGTTAAAAVAVAQLLPAAAVAPVASRIVDARGPAVGLWVGYVAQAIAMAATALLLLGGAPPLAAYAAAAAAASAVTLTRPAQGALLPALVDEPAELTAANAVTGWLESLSVLAGPALAGLLIGVRGVDAVFGLFAVVVAGSAALVAPLLRDGGGAPTGVAPDAEDAAGALEALRATRGGPAVVAALGAGFLGIGALDVLVVVLAIEVLDAGSATAGYLNAAFGAGGVVGGFAAIALVGRRTLVAPLLAAAVGWGAAFAAIAAWPTVAGAFALLAAAGAARVVLDVAGRTLLQRIAAAEVRGRVFGALESVSMLACAAGSLAVPLLAALGGPRTAIAGVAVVLVVVPFALAEGLRVADRSAPAVDRELALLRGSPLFAMLAAPVLEELARSLVRTTASAGAVVVREGEPGDRFFLVGDGTLDVAVAGRRVGALRPGDGFGEIALLRDGVRTSTVTARAPVTLFALDRVAFLEALTGSPQAHRAAEDLAGERLRTHRVGVGA